MNLQQMIVEAFQLEGGLDLVSPALALKPGNCIASQNFEPDINGGYRRMYGYERYDGRWPSQAVYSIMHATVTGTIAVGDTLTGMTSGKTAKVLVTTADYLVVRQLIAGTWTASENLQVSGITVATFTSILANGASTPVLHARYKNLAADDLRALIGKVPGSGPVRGVWIYNDAVYAFRDNALGTACVMHKQSTSSGWQAVSLGTEVQFTTGNGTAPMDGSTVTQGGVTATVRRVMTRTGTWTGTAAGTFVISDLAGGNFAAGAASLTGGATVSLTGAETAITLAPGGRYEFANYNFSGSAATLRMYGCDGKNYAFEFDGTYYCPIRTGMTTDTPTFITAWKNMLVLAFGSNVEVSGTVAPYSWTALTGAAELALGAPITGLLPQVGNESVGALCIFTQTKTFVLYGNDSNDFNLVVQSEDAGARPYSAQNIGFAFYLDTKGIVSLATTKNYGNFIMSTLSRKVQPLIDTINTTSRILKASCIVRATNQYRLFFSDGTGLILYMVGDKVGAIMPFNYGSAVYFNTVCSQLMNGSEVVLAAGSDGYVYKLESGTNFDGDHILAYLFLAFNSSRSPRNIKRYRRAVLQATCKNTADVTIGFEFDYGSNETRGGDRSAQTLSGNGTYWEVGTWDGYTWDAPYVAEYVIDMPGNGRNVGMLIYGETDENEPFTVHSAVMHYMIGRQER